jgi:hypothetical protein
MVKRKRGLYREGKIVDPPPRPHSRRGWAGLPPRPRAGREEQEVGCAGQ